MRRRTWPAALALLALAGAVMVPAVAQAAGGKPLTVALAIVGQPADAEVDAIITTERIDPNGDPVTVALLVTGGTPRERAAVLKADLEVELHIDDDPTGGQATLGGAVAAVVDGVATFDALTLDAHGRDFTLVATLEAEIKLPDKSTLVLDLTSDPSERFTIWEEVFACGPGVPCSIGAERAGTVRVDVDAPVSEGTLLFSLLDEQLVCEGDHARLPTMSLFDAIGVEGEKTATILIDSSVAHETPNNGRAHYQVCYLGDAPFVDRDGNPVGSDTGEPLTFGPALLPDCQNRPLGQGAPCVESRTGAPGGDVRIRIRLPAGDPGWM